MFCSSQNITPILRQQHLGLLCTCTWIIYLWRFGRFPSPELASYLLATSELSFTVRTCWLILNTLQILTCRSWPADIFLTFCIIWPAWSDWRTLKFCITWPADLRWPAIKNKLIAVLTCFGKSPSTSSTWPAWNRGDRDYCFFCNSKILFSFQTLLTKVTAGFFTTEHNTHHLKRQLLEILQLTDAQNQCSAGGVCRNGSVTRGWWWWWRHHVRHVWKVHGHAVPTLRVRLYRRWVPRWNRMNVHIAYIFFQLLLSPGLGGSVRRPRFLYFMYCTILAGCRDSNPRCCDCSKACYQMSCTHP